MIFVPTAVTVRTAGRVTTTRNMVSGVCARRALWENTARWNVSHLSRIQLKNNKNPTALDILLRTSQVA